MSDLDGPAARKYRVVYGVQTLPITNLFCGEHEVADLECADTFVAGPAACGKWVSGDVDDFEIVRIN